jgi:hypothetical protein
MSGELAGLVYMKALILGRGVGYIQNGLSASEYGELIHREGGLYLGWLIF